MNFERRFLWSILFSASLALMLGCESQRSVDPVRPNIIVFLVDDMGWQDTSVAFHSARTRFNQFFRTPNMERISESGIRFTQAYAAAVCSPTRTSIMTGQNPARHKVTNWTLFPDKDQSGETDRLRAPADWKKEGLQPGSVTLPDLLRKSGYQTIHCGKAHWGTHETPGSDPLRLGFDVNIAGHAAGAPGHYHAQENFGNAAQGSYTKPWGVPGLEKYHGTETHLTDALTIEALEAVENAVSKRNPFYLYMAHYAVHTPIQEHRPYIDNYRGNRYADTEIEIPEEEALYASMVEGMDNSLGQILRKLEELGVAEDTILLFVSDNGGLSAHARGTTPRGTGKDTHNWPLKAGKGSAYEGGTRIPMLVSWAKLDPGNSNQKRYRVEPGSFTGSPVIVEDLFPTICSLAGIEIPSDYQTQVDGVDLRETVTGENPVPENRVLIFHYPHVWGAKGLGYEPHSAMRKGSWKIIYFYEPQRWELYNLADDLGEEHDLSEVEPGQLIEMASIMQAELERLGAQFPQNKESGDEEIPVWPVEDSPQDG